MKIRTLIGIPIVIAALAYVGVKGYIYYKVKTDLDNMIRTAAPFLQIQYGGIGSDLNGSISIDRVLLTPTGSYDEISIRQLEISGNGPKFLFELAQGFKQSEPPAQMSIAVHQLESPVTSSFLSSIGARLGASTTTPWKDKADACSLAGILQASGLKELGFPGFTINGGMGYNYDQDAGVVQFNVDYDLSGVESSYLNLRLSGLTAAGIMGIGKMPAFEQLRLVRNIEPGYMKQIVTLCAGNAAQSPDQFIEALVSRPAKHYLTTLGFIPGPGLIDLFKQLVTNAGELEIQANPSAGIDPSKLPAYRTSDLVDLLGITVRYNNKPVTDLSFSTQLKKPAHGATPAPGNNQTSPTIVEKPAVKPVTRSRPKLRYIETDIADLADHLLYRVRIYTLDNDRPKRGVLISIKNQTVNVEQVLYSGKMTVHLHTSRIDRIEVLKREP
ncbi:MAG: hypothetical protein GY799_22960 [Desulfobulbaceae bacterium]|nr:hypothetical protein [Desulfobulbaceae bacterium]